MALPAKMERNDFCCLHYCENYKRCDRSVTLYPAPYRDSDRAVWAKAFGIPMSCLNDETKICSLHFLRKTQVPQIVSSLSPAPSSGLIALAPKLKGSDYCCIPYCENYRRLNHSATLYPAPRSDSERCVWARAFGIPKTCLSSENARVCSLHFLRKNDPPLPVAQDNQPPKTRSKVVRVVSTVSTPPIPTESAYEIFCSSYRRQLMMQKKDISNCLKFRQECAKEWNSLPANQKKVFLDSAVQSASHFMIKTSNFPTHPRSPFTIFLAEFAANPESLRKMPDKFKEGKSPPPLTRLAHQKWRSMSQEEMQPYLDKFAEALQEHENAVEELKVLEGLKAQEEAAKDLSASNEDNQSVDRLYGICSSLGTMPQDTLEVPARNSSPPALPLTPRPNANNVTPFSRSLRSILFCDLYLDCQEEELTPVQKNYQAEEWLNYCKFNTNIKDLPSVYVKQDTKGTSEGLSNTNLPMLVFSNSFPAMFPPMPQPTVVNSSALSPVLSNPAPLIIQFPVSSPPGSNAAASTIIVSSPPSISSPVFPVMLQKAPVESDDRLSTMQLHVEEVIPLVQNEKISMPVIEPTFQDKQVFSDVSVSGSMVAQKPEEAIIVINNNAPIPLLPDVDSTTDQVDGSELANVQVCLEDENVASPIPKTYTDASQYAADALRDDFEGPKIISILGGNTGAQEYFKDATNSSILAESFVTQSVETFSPALKQNSMNSLPKAVSQSSIFSMQKTIAVITSGTEDASVRNLLKLRSNLPPFSVERESGQKLRNLLRDTYYMTLPIWWLVKKNYLPLYSHCTLCNGKVFKLDYCPTATDYLSFTCSKCRDEKPFLRPDFFKKFGKLSLEECMLLMYHWSCKSRYFMMKKDLCLTDQVIFNFFAALQELCGRYLDLNCPLGQSNSTISDLFPGLVTPIVEVSAVKLGKFFIICGYCRVSKLTRMKAITTEKACSSLAHIDAIRAMLPRLSRTHCIVVTWKKISEEILPGVTTVSADSSITMVSSPGYHILNASRYLGKTLVDLFKGINHDWLLLNTVQGYLDEVTWRDRFDDGKSEECSFWNIWNQIVPKKTIPANCGAVIFGPIHYNRYFYKNYASFQFRWGPFSSKLAAKSASALCEKLEKEIVFVGNPVEVNPSIEIVEPKKSFQPVITKVAKAPEPKYHPITVFCQVTQSASKGMEKESSELNISAKELLSVKILFITHSSFQESLKEEALKLGKQLRHEGFLSKPIMWLAKKKLITSESRCYVCSKKTKLVESSRHSDGVSWRCSNPVCMFENQYRRPTFFAYFGFDMEVLFTVVYHWAVQSDYQTLMNSIPLNEHNIICIFRKIQKICALISNRPSVRIGGLRCLVEVALVKFSNCFILGAMERSSKLSRFKAFPIIAKLHIDEIRGTLLNWLRPNTTVIVNSNKYFGSYCMNDKINLVFSDKSISDVKDTGYHTLTISQYLQNHMRTMFSYVKVQLMKADVLQLYLDEIVWRERYGRSPMLAFKNIMQDIFLTDTFRKGRSFSYYPMNSHDAASGMFSLPEVKIVLERLSDEVIQKYLNPSTREQIPDDDDDIEFLEIVPKKRNVKAEITISDDDDDDDVQKKAPEAEKPFDFKSNENSVDNSLGSSAISEADSKLAFSDLSQSDTEQKRSASPAVVSQDIPPSSVPSTSSVTLPSYRLPSPVMEASLSSSDSSSSISKDQSIAHASSSAGLHLSSQEPYSTNLNLASQGPSSKKLTIDKSIFFRPTLANSVKKKSTDRSYSSRKRTLKAQQASQVSQASQSSLDPVPQPQGSDFQCIECKEDASPSHFVKMYQCDDCRHSKYSTYCQKAFAHHRAYVLFGRKIPPNYKVVSGQYHHHVLLKNHWHCSCGFKSRDGNKLASHLVKCHKTTCYFSDDEDIEVDVVS